MTVLKDAVRRLRSRVARSRNRLVPRRTCRAGRPSAQTPGDRPAPRHSRQPQSGCAPAAGSGFVGPWLRSDEPGPYGVRYSVCTVAQVVALHGAGKDVLHGAFGVAQFLCDLIEVVSFGQKAKHVDLSGGIA